MSDLAFIALMALLLWWAAQVVLCLHEYLRKRNEVKALPPLTEEERAEIARSQADFPRKDMSSLWRSLTSPKEVVQISGVLLVNLVFVIVFLPVIVGVCVLPDPNRR